MNPPPPPPPNIYIVGTQCTGKTTLVNNLRTYFTTTTTTPSPPTPYPQPTFITEVARTVLQTHSFTAADVRDPARSLALQRLILAAQAAAEGDALGQATPTTAGRWFISDRSGADPLAYALRYVGSSGTRPLLESAEWAVLRERMRGAVVVVCEASAGVAGWLRDDGVRLMPEDVEEWVGFHEMFCQFLEGEGVEFEVLPAGVGGHGERVGFVVERWMGRWKGLKEGGGGGRM
ncbi:AAA domain-containing protein [Staphylotrichum tortipilum]|uniref:AAA domain-containing protein n=1 Tax=Staphylotrichum tortipilum TaxID=2831512 RepID=A0AAN6MLS0_9PEZI|nr:AAA domain-containing protein [Staphylotrichum longicolle]